jgi:LacI family transcriptional regulator
MKRITIKDLARHLSLSTSTISRAFVNDQHIHPETKKRILDAAKELGYKPNPTALSLRYGHTKNIGLVVPEMLTPFSASVLRGIQNVLTPKGYRVIIQQSDEDPLVEYNNILFLQDFNVDAIIINPCHDTQNINLYQSVIEGGIPMIFFDRIPEASLDVSKVVINDAIQAALMVEHLIENGHRTIAHIMGPSSIKNAKERAMGYERILTKHHIYNRDLVIKTDGMSVDDGRKAVEKLLKIQPEMDAIFAFSDTLAIGAMNCLLAKGYRIPEDIAIASFSGTELATLVYPPLTTVEQPLVQMGEKAAGLALGKIQNSTMENETIVLHSELVYRASTAKPKRN